MPAAAWGLLIVAAGLAPGRAEADKPLVLIHYANETSPEGQEAADYQTVIEHLRQLGTDRAHRIAANLQREPKLFGAAVAAERDVLKRLPRELDVAVCLFDNRGARHGEFACWRPGVTSATVVSLDVPKFDDPRLTANPLTTPAGLAAALAAVAREFPPRDYRYALIVKSHGSKDLAMTIQFPRLREMTSLETLRREIDSASPPPAAAIVGAAKGELFAVLRHAGTQHGMQFALVVLETCDGVLDHVTVQSLPENVQRLFASGNQKLQFSTIPYQSIVAEARTAADLLNRMDAALSDTFLRLSRKSRLLSALAWCVPLLVLVAWRWLRGRRGDSAPGAVEAAG